TWKLRLPWGWNTGEPGPVEAQPGPDRSELNNAAVEPICKKYLELRYRLLPYNYTLLREDCDTGLPPMRALWLHYPGDAEAVKRGASPRARGAHRRAKVGVGRRRPFTLPASPAGDARRRGRPRAGARRRSQAPATTLVAGAVQRPLPGWLRGPAAGAGDVAQQGGEGPLARAGEAPVDRRALVAVVGALALHAVVEVAPGDVALDGRDEVVARPVEVEVVVLVDQHRHGAVARHRPRLADQGAEPVGAVLAVAVEEQEVRRPHHRLDGDGPAAEAGAGQ